MIEDRILIREVRHGFPDGSTVVTTQRCELQLRWMNSQTEATNMACLASAVGEWRLLPKGPESAQPIQKGKQP